MSTANVRIIRDTGGKGLDALIKRLGRGEKRVLVGVPKGAGDEGPGVSVAFVAAMTEFGGGTKRASGPVQQGGEAPTGQRQPERPFLRGGIRRALPKVRATAARDLAAVAEGRMTMDVALERAGETGAGSVKEYMAGPHFEANAPSTIKKKGSSQPTIDDAQLRQSITHVLESKA